MSTIESTASPEDSGITAPEAATPTWPIIKGKLERNLRRLCLRWGRPAEEDVAKIIRMAVGELVGEEDWLYKKAVFKCHSNIATWKNRVLAAMTVGACLLPLN